MDLAIEKTFDGECWRVSLQGEIDLYNSAELKSQLIQLMDEHIADIYVDCKWLDYIDSTGLGTLVAAFKNIKSHDKGMHLFNVKPSILKLFRITNLDKVFNISAPKGG